MTTSDVIINLRVNSLAAKKELKDTKAQMKEFQKSAKKGSDEQKAAFENIARSQEKARKNQEALNQKISKQFPAWALSVMFFGMVVHRTMSKVWRTTTSTFQDVMHSVEGAVTEFDHLNGAMEWLRFTAGSALEPIAGMLFPIVLAVGDWISENESLFRGLVMFFGATGTFAAIIGGSVTAIHGISKAFSEVIASSKNADWGKIGSNIQKGIGVISIAYGLYQLNQAADEKSLERSLLKTLSGAANAIGGVRFLQGKDGAAPLLAVGVALSMVEQGTFFTKVFSLIGVVTALFGAMIDGIATHFENGLFDGIKRGIVSAVEWMLGSPVLKVFDVLMGTNLSGELNAALNQAVGTTNSSFNFWDSYFDELANMRAVGAQFDENVQRGLDDAERRRNSEVVINNNFDGGTVAGAGTDPALLDHISEVVSGRILRDIEALGQ